MRPSGRASKSNSARTKPLLTECSEPRITARNPMNARTRGSSKCSRMNGSGVVSK